MIIASQSDHIHLQEQGRRQREKGGKKKPEKSDRRPGKNSRSLITL
jgi:hypothetical protein